MGGAGEPGRLAGRVGVVTGAGRGVGRAIALALAAEGMQLALFARTAGQVQAVAEEIGTAYDLPVLPAAVDVRDAAAVDRLAAHVEQRLGPVDLLVNNAGRADAVEAPLWEADVEDVWDVVETNLRGPLLLTRAFLPAMVARRQGRIVNINSLAAVRPAQVYLGYALSKAALARLTDSLAAMLEGTGVSVFDLSPGLVRTAMTADAPIWKDVPDEHWTPAEAAAAAVVALAGGELDALSGRFLHAAEDLTALCQRIGQLRAVDARTLRMAAYGPEDEVLG